MIEHVHKAAFCQNIIRKKQLGIVGHRTETLVDDGIIVTPGSNKQSKLFGYLRIIVQQFHDAPAKLFFHRGKMPLACFVHNNRCTCGIGILEYRRTEIVLLQDTDGTQTVEPGIGSFFVHFIDTFLLYTIEEGYPLIVKSLCI
ncbi:unknown [Bacteroides sp. CAG:714]|nr:unknown [Bacteroides sp. CAG:714]